MTQDPNTVPQEVRDYAYGYGEDYEYSDTWRFAIRGDYASEEVYRKIHEKGCCGSVDFVQVPFLVDGKQWYFGFNYGH